MITQEQALQIAIEECKNREWLWALQSLKTVSLEDFWLFHTPDEDKAVGLQIDKQTGALIWAGPMTYGKWSITVVSFSALGFHLYATDFLSAARAVDNPDRFSPVPYYLYCRALELVLKAFLLAKGVSGKKTFRHDLGHNLENILNLAEQHGLTDFVTLSAKERENLIKANNYYKPPAKVFEYFVAEKVINGYQSLPELATLDSLTETLITRLDEICSKVEDYFS